jgi:TonB family protein
MLGTGPPEKDVVFSGGIAVPDIFISYRRNDSQGEAGRLFDDLAKHFGENGVYMDVAAIEPGRDFRKAIEEGVTKCGVLLVLMGPQWVDAKDERGARRLDDPSDFVRIETASALKRDIPVIPVLVRNARMPSGAQLPDDLKELVYRNCIELTHARWKSDVQLLVDALRRLVGGGDKPAASAGAVRSGGPQAKVAASTRESIDSTTFDTGMLLRVARELADYIGPIASIVVKRAASHCDSLEELYLKISEEIDSPEGREKFLLGHAPVPRTPSPPAVTMPSVPLALVGSPPTSDSESDRPATEGVSPPEVAKHSASRTKYVFLTVALGVLLIVAIAIVVAEHRSSRKPEVTETARATQNTGKPSLIPKSAPGQAASPATEIEPAMRAKLSENAVPHAKAERLPESTERVHVPEDVSNKMRIEPAVTPVYPVLARQARIQGMVVLDANISRHGVVESLTVVSGPALLISAAMDAAKQWRYRPYMVKGKLVPVNTQVSVNFAITNQ